uniref:Carm1 protein n=1 Tax=Fopius arisanus TaxID=64838 RepID=A0A0C9PRC9_9HYME
MLSISAPSKFVLTLQSVPPFFLESFLAFILVILLAIPLIARAQMLLENPMNYFPPVPRKHPPIFPPPSREQPPTPAINVNLQLDTIRSNPLSSPSPEDELNFDIQLLPLIRKKSLQTCPSDTSTHDYELYRHNFIELNLKKQFGERIPGNVVLNAHHLSTIDSKILLKVNRNFPENLFDFIEPPSTRKVKPHPPQPHPTDHFLPRNSKNPSKNLISIDKAIGTLDPSLEIDQVPELIDFKERTTPTSPRSPRRLAESADNVKILNTRNSRKKTGVNVKSSDEFACQT